MCLEEPGGADLTHHKAGMVLIMPKEIHRFYLAS